MCISKHVYIFEVNTGFLDGLQVEVEADQISIELYDGISVGNKEKLFSWF